MSSILFPILPLQLDPRNTISLTREIQSKIYEASEGELNDFSPSSPLSALTEGQAFAQGELLYYMNNLPEAWTLQWLRLLGIQRILGSTSTVEITFFKTTGYPGIITIPKGTRISTPSGLTFSTSSDVSISESDSLATVSAISTGIGSKYNISAGEISNLLTPFVGISSVTNFNPAFGGSDLETIDQLKNRAFEFIKKRGLITKADFESFVASSIGFRGPVFCLDSDTSELLDFPINSVNILACGPNGEPISIDEKSKILTNLELKSPIGSSISIIDPIVNPVSIRVEVSSIATPSTRSVCQSIYSLLSSVINPSSIGFGNNIDWTTLANSIKSIREVSNLLYLSIDVYSGKYDFSPRQGNEISTFLNLLTNLSSEGIFINDNPISTYRLYSLDVYIAPGGDFASGITYSYGALYDL